MPMMSLCEQRGALLNCAQRRLEFHFNIRNWKAKSPVSNFARPTEGIGRSAVNRQHIIRTLEKAVECRMRRSTFFHLSPNPKSTDGPNIYDSMWHVERFDLL